MATSTMQETEKYLIFKVAEDLYGLDVTYLKEVFQTTKIIRLPRTSEILAGIVNLRGYIVSIFNLYKLLWGLAPTSESELLEESNSSSQAKIVLLLTIKNQDVGILADQIYQLAEIAEFGTKDPKYFKGRELQNDSLITKVGFIEDNQEVLILNLDVLLSGYVVPAKIQRAPVSEDDDFDFDQYTLPDEGAIDQFDPMAFADIDSMVEESIKDEEIKSDDDKKKKKSNKGSKEKSEEKST
ncbi:MAG: chemotaxis protein CheW [Candidatus Hodarchaeota archaeon]